MRENRIFKIIDRYLGIPLIFFLGQFPKKKNPKKGPLKKILLIKLSALGDTILLFPIIKAIKKKYPDSEVDIIVSIVNLEVAKNCSYLDNIFLFDIKKHLKNPFSFFKFILKIREQKYEVALDFDQWLRASPLIAFFSNVPLRIGFKTKGQAKHFLYHYSVLHNSKIHEIENFARILNLIGIKNVDKNLYWEISPEVKDFVAKFLKENVKKEEILIAFHPGCPQTGWQRKWPTTNYIKLGTILSKKYPLKIILSGTKQERGTLEIIKKELANQVIVLPQELSLAQLAGILNKCKFLVSGNTGIMHLAVAVGIPVIALHGPTNPVQWGPLGEKSFVISSSLDCSPCLDLGFEYGCRTARCMRSIKIDEVLSRCYNLLKDEKN